MSEYNALTKKSIKKKSFQKIAEIILKKELTDRSYLERNLSIVLVGQGKIKELNKKYRKENSITDVLSFPYDDSGEIVICPEEVKNNAKKYNSTYKEELTRVLIHGILHLLGYNHEKSEKETKKMRKKEEYYLKLCQGII